MSRIYAWIKDLEAWEILLYFTIAAFVVQWVLTRIVMGVTRRTKFDLDDEIVAALRMPILVTIVLFGAVVAVNRLGLDPENWLMKGTGGPLGPPHHHVLAYTIGVLSWMRGLMRACDALLDAMARHADRYSWIQPRSLPIFDILFRLVTIGVAVYLILAKWDINLTGWLASAGILGIAVGFAAKDTLANLFAGIFILADAPYKLGDFVVLGTGERGRVTDIGIRSTRILTRDDIEVTIPNSLIANGTVVNETGGPHDKRRVRVTVGVAYGSDVDKVKQVLMDVGVNSEYAAKIPEPRVRFREFGDSALIFQLMVWIDEPVLRGRAVDDLNTALYKSFIKEGIEIPFPQRVVHMPKT